MLKLGMKIFIPFPKPSQGIERTQRWINACSRENFTVDKITRNTYDDGIPSNQSSGLVEHQTRPSH